MPSAALGLCRDCGGRASLSAASCPHCGAADPTGFLTLMATRKRVGLLAILGALIMVFGLLMGLFSYPTREESGLAFGVVFMLLGGALVFYWVQFERRFSRAIRQIQAGPSGSPTCPRCGSSVQLSRPICPKCGTRVHLSRPA